MTKEEHEKNYETLLKLKSQGMPTIPFPDEYDPKSLHPAGCEQHGKLVWMTREEYINIKGQLK